jgi:hypothetical protein
MLSFVLLMTPCYHGKTSFTIINGENNWKTTKFGRTSCIMGQRVNKCSQLKPLGGGAVNTSLKRTNNSLKFTKGR